MHLLKNGHPAHVFNDEDRRKAAAVTNQVRRERNEIAAMEFEAEAIERLVERRRARRARNAARQRERRARLREQEQTQRVVPWFERGLYAGRPSD